MAWTEAEIGELIATVRADLNAGRVTDDWYEKLHEHGVTETEARQTISKRSYIVKYEHWGRTIGFFNPDTLIFVAWRADPPTRVKTAFVEYRGLAAIQRLMDAQFLWEPR